MVSNCQTHRWSPQHWSGTVTDRLPRCLFFLSCSAKGSTAQPQGKETIGRRKQAQADRPSRKPGWKPNRKQSLLKTDAHFFSPGMHFVSSRPPRVHRCRDSPRPGARVDGDIGVRAARFLRGSVCSKICRIPSCLDHSVAPRVATARPREKGAAVEARCCWPRRHGLQAKEAQNMASGQKKKMAFWSVGRHPRGKRRCEWFEFLGDIIRPALLVPHSALCSTGWLVWAFGPWLDEHAAGMVPAGTNKDCKHSAVADNHCGDAVRSKCRGNLLQSCISAGGWPETSKKMCIIYIYILYINNKCIFIQSQPPFQKRWFLLDDD